MPHKFYLRRDLDHGNERCVLYEARRHGRVKVGSLKGWRLSVALPYVRKLSSSPPQTRTHDHPSANMLALIEEDGVRLSLTFLGIRRLRKLEKAERLARGISAMSQEESYYWYAKTSVSQSNSTAIKALRTLFGNQ
jgi:hypothetical protein